MRTELISIGPHCRSTLPSGRREVTEAVLLSRQYQIAAFCTILCAHEARIPSL